MTAYVYNLKQKIWQKRSVIQYSAIQCIITSCCALLCIVVQPAIALAQNTTDVETEMGQTEMGQAELLANVPSTQETTDMTPAARPPLPFSAPQIGPLIKRAPMDDIARRTTAFIPHTLDGLNLSPVTDPDENKWIHVDLSEQLVVAYQDGAPIRGFVISSGLPGTPTVTGEFRIRTKVSEQTMFGGVGANYYNLPGVKWVQYFYEDYSFHGTYWHSNFGNPMSHGCVNMTDADAKWLFDWAGPVWDGETVWYKSTAENPGTLVIVTQ